MKSEEFSLVCIIQGKEQTKGRLKQVLQSIAAETQNEPGNVSYELCVCDDDDSLFIVCETWKHQAALDAHMNQPYLKSFLAEAEELLARPVDAKRCRKISP